MGLEARTHAQSLVPNSCRCILLIGESRGRDAAPRRPVGRHSAPTLPFICPAPGAVGFLLHRLRVAFAGKEEGRGAYPPDSIGR